MEINLYISGVYKYHDVEKYAHSLSAVIYKDPHKYLTDFLSLHISWSTPEERDRDLTLEHVDDLLSGKKELITGYGTAHRIVQTKDYTRIGLSDSAGGDEDNDYLELPTSDFRKLILDFGNARMDFNNAVAKGLPWHSIPTKINPATDPLDPMYYNPTTNKSGNYYDLPEGKAWLAKHPEENQKRIERYKSLGLKIPTT